MLMGYSLGDLGSIMAMQGFAGLILFSVSQRRPLHFAVRSGAASGLPVGDGLVPAEPDG
jgi:hypothetical protein